MGYKYCVKYDSTFIKKECVCGWIHTHSEIYVDLNFNLHSFQFSCSDVTDSATPESQYPRPPCPSPTAGVYPNPCPWSQ